MSGATAKKLIFRLDGHVGSATVSGVELSKSFPEAEILSVSNTQSSAFSETPDLIVCADGAEAPESAIVSLISWAKRNPGLHHVPIAVLSSAPTEARKRECFRAGAVEYLRAADASQLGKCLNARPIEAQELREMDRSFASETLDRCEEAHRLIDLLSSADSAQAQQAGKELYRVLHTIKGVASSLQFPHLGEFVHRCETFVSARSVFDAAMGTTLHSAMGYLEGEMEYLRARRILTLPPETLLTSLSDTRTVSAVSASAEKSSVRVEQPAGVLSRSSGSASGSIRVTNEKLNELQTRFKRIQQIRVKLNSFTHALQSEFPGEAFGRDLGKLVEDLGTEAAGILEFFIETRVVPASRIKNFSERALQAASEATGKPARLTFECEDGLEIDLPIAECAESSIAHLVRNCLDHGIEDAKARESSGKAACARVTVSVKREGFEKIIVTVQDDGRGIDRERIKSAVFSKGLVGRESIDRLNDAQVLDMVFVDGISTKGAVTEMSGRGVGLSAVRESVTKLGGEIKVTSEPGQGTCFMMKLPRVCRL